MNQRIPVIFLLAAACDQPEPCFTPYVPTGPLAADHCDCPEGFLYYCAEPETCAGDVGVTTCEASGNGHVFYLPHYCDNCTIAWNEHGAFYVTCVEE